MSNGGMVTARRSAWVPHAVLIAGLMVVLFPIYVAFVASSHALPAILDAPMTLVPGSHLIENLRQALAAGTAKTSGEPVAAMLLVILAAAWKQISYNFLFFLAGLQAIPPSLIEASAIDGASPRRRFWTIIFPLLAPTSFFLLVVNIVYAFFDTFGVIHNVTQGGPAKATEILVYKVWYDGIVGLDLGGSAAQSVVLMAIVIGLTAIQFRFIERRVHYA